MKALLALLITPLAAQIRGGALIEKPSPSIITWGDQLLSWPLDGGTPRVLLGHTNFGAGGCVADVDRDGRDDLLALDGRRLLWLKAPAWKARVVEADTDFRDCLPFAIEGRRGVVFAHLNSQVRFYLFPRFEYKELYSIYTASAQGGLLAHDVDGDGLADLFIGNYWMKNPGRLGVAWRLYAINTFHETPTAAMASLGRWNGKTLFWASGAHVAAFDPQPDVKQLWIEHRLAPLDDPRSVLVQPQGVFIGHADGVALESPSASGWRRTVVAHGFAVLKLIAWGDRIFAVTPGGVRVVAPQAYRSGRLPL